MDQTLTPLTVTTVHQHMCTICTHKSVYTSSTNYTSLSIYTSIWSIGTRIRSFTVGVLILESLHIARYFDSIINHKNLTTSHAIEIS